MNTQKTIVRNGRRLASLFVIAAATLPGIAVAEEKGRRPSPPAASEFGTGPRTSVASRYVATLQPDTPLRPRQLYTIRVAVTGQDGRAIENAEIAIDGGMPQHGHGLPTRPRITQSLGGGVYEIGGLRFNMGGWWELRLAINSAAGPDTVTFNLHL